MADDDWLAATAKPSVTKKTYGSVRPVFASRPVNTLPVVASVAAKSLTLGDENVKDVAAKPVITKSRGSAAVGPTVEKDKKAKARGAKAESVPAGKKLDVLSNDKVAAKDKAVPKAQRAPLIEEESEPLVEPISGTPEKMRRVPLSGEAPRASKDTFGLAGSSATALLQPAKVKRRRPLLKARIANAMQQRASSNAQDTTAVVSNGSGKQKKGSKTTSTAVPSSAALASQQGPADTASALNTSSSSCASDGTAMTYASGSSSSACSSASAAPSFGAVRRALSLQTPSIGLAVSNGSTTATSGSWNDVMEEGGSSLIGPAGALNLSSTSSASSSGSGSSASGPVLDGIDDDGSDSEQQQTQPSSMAMAAAQQMQECSHDDESEDSETDGFDLGLLAPSAPASAASRRTMDSMFRRVSMGFGSLAAVTTNAAVAQHQQHRKSSIGGAGLLLTSELSAGGAAPASALLRRDSLLLQTTLSRASLLLQPPSSRLSLISGSTQPASAAALSGFASGRPSIALGPPMASLSEGAEAEEDDNDDEEEEERGAIAATAQQQHVPAARAFGALAEAEVEEDDDDDDIPLVGVNSYSRPSAAAPVGIASTARISAAVAAPISIRQSVAATLARQSRLSILPTPALAALGQQQEEASAAPSPHTEAAPVEPSSSAVVVSSSAPRPDPITSGLGQALSSILEYLPSSSLLHCVPVVNRQWHRVAGTVFSWRVASEMTSIASQPLEAMMLTPPQSAASEQGGKAKKGAAKSAKSAARGKVPAEAVTSSAAAEVEPRVPLLTSWLPFLRAFPWGSFLSEGAYKQVYCVWNSNAGRMEAVSVMDVDAIAGTGNLPVIQAEIQCGCLLSELVRTGVSPHYLEMHQVFMSAYSPGAHFPRHWGTTETRSPQGPCPYGPDLTSLQHAEALAQQQQQQAAATPPASSATAPAAGRGSRGKKAAASSIEFTAAAEAESPLLARAWRAATYASSSLSADPRSPLTSASAAPLGRYQYIRMELCTGGDLEDYLRKVEPIVAAAEEAAASAAASAEAATSAALESAAAALAQLDLTAALASAAAGRASVRVRKPATTSATAGKGRATGLTSAAEAAAACAAAASTAAFLQQIDRLSAEWARGALFQMMHSLYAAQERLTLRHYDVKALNFLLKPAKDAVADLASRPGGRSSGEVDDIPAEGAVLSVEISSDGDSSSGNSLRISYGIDGQRCVLRLASSPSASSSASAAASPLTTRFPEAWGALSGGDAVVKLADYGTADTRPESLGTPIKPYHFTTLENAPPEYMLLGDACVQGYEADAWGLGLCAVHLLTGAAPYEEVMAAVRCPVPLREAMLQLWTSASGGAAGGSGGRKKKGAAAAGGSDVTPTYRALGTVLAHDEDNIVADTLYRILVLCGPQAIQAGAAAYGSSSSSSSPLSLPIWRLITCALLPSASSATAAAAPPAENSGGKGRGAGRRSPHTVGPDSDGSLFSDVDSAKFLAGCGISKAVAITLANTYAKDVAGFSLWTGSHALMTRARRRMALLPGAAEVVRSLLALHPSERLTMKEALYAAELFSAFRC